MRAIEDGWLFLGNARDLSDPKGVNAAGVRAVVELAIEEPGATLSRELVRLRYPLYDGPGNEMMVLDAAIAGVASLISRRIPSLVCCSNGMSRSPSIVACAISRVNGESPGDVLGRVTRGAPADVSPFLWDSLLRTLEAAG